jgi:hypothetical protein
MRQALRLAILAAAFALGTWVFGWLAVPGVAVAWGIIARSRARPAIEASLASVIAWTGLFVSDALRGPVLMVGKGIGSAIGVSGAMLLLLSLVFAALLAWSAAVVARELALLVGGGVPAPGGSKPAP